MGKFRGKKNSNQAVRQEATILGRFRCTQCDGHFGNRGGLARHQPTCNGKLKKKRRSRKIARIPHLDEVPENPALDVTFEENDEAMDVSLPDEVQEEIVAEEEDFEDHQVGIDLDEEEIVDEDDALFEEDFDGGNPDFAGKQITFDLEKELDLKIVFPITPRRRTPTKVKPNEQLRAYLAAVTKNKWYPFRSELEFEISDFILENGLSIREANRLLKITGIGRTEEEFTLRNIYDIRSRLQLVPKDKWEVLSVKNPLKPEENLQFYRRNGWRVLQEMFCDPVFYKKFHMQFEREEENGSRVFGSFHSGLFFEHLQANIPPGATPLVYNLFSDGTVVQKLGKLSMHPIFMTCANLHEEERVKDRSWRLVGLLPILGGTETEKKTEKFKAAKRALFQTCLSSFMETFEIPSQEGRKIADFGGKLHTVFPFFGYVSCDWPESKLYTLTRDGNKTAMPCGCCMCPRDRLSLLATQWPLRTVQESEFLVKKALSMKITRGNELLKRYSLKREINPLWKYCNPYAQRLPDLLHHINLGIVKKYISYVVAYLSEIGDHKVDEFDKAFVGIGDISGVKTFRNGISKLTLLTGDEYEDIALSLPHVLELIEVEEHVAAPAKAILEVFLALRRRKFTIETLKDLLKAQKHLESALELSTLSRFCPSEFQLVKMHDLGHHVMSVMLFERPMLYSTQAGERLNGRSVKGPYQRGNKKDNEEFITGYDELCSSMQKARGCQERLWPKKEKKKRKYDTLTTSGAEKFRWKDLLPGSDLLKARPKLDGLRKELSHLFKNEALLESSMKFHSSLWLPNKSSRVVASPDFYGHPRFDIVQVKGDDECWFAEVHAIFECIIGKQRRSLCWIQWFEDIGRRNSLGVKTLKRVPWFQIIEAASIDGEVPVSKTRVKDQFHLAEWILRMRQRNEEEGK